MDFKDIHSSKKVRIAVSIILIVIVALGIFKAGEVVGFHKAKFSRDFGDNFHRNFTNSHNGFFRQSMGDMMDDKLPPAGYGTVGKIVSMASSTLVVADKDNLEKTVLVNSETSIREFRDELKVTDLKVGDFVVILGTPDDKGEIEARLVRIIPTPEETATSTLSSV